MHNHLLYNTFGDYFRSVYVNIDNCNFHLDSGMFESVNLSKISVSITDIVDTIQLLIVSKRFGSWFTATHTVLKLLYFVASSTLPIL